MTRLKTLKRLTMRCNERRPAATAANAHPPRPHEWGSLRILTFGIADYVNL